MYQRAVFFAVLPTFVNYVTLSLSPLVTFTGVSVVFLSPPGIPYVSYRDLRSSVLCPDLRLPHLNPICRGRPLWDSPPPLYIAFPPSVGG